MFLCCAALRCLRTLGRILDGMLVLRKIENVPVVKLVNYMCYTFFTLHLLFVMHTFSIAH